MPAPVIAKATVWEDSAAVLMARVHNLQGANLTQASVTSITLHVFDLRDANKKIVDARDLPKATHVFDALQTPPIWTVDSDGFNFRYDPQAADLPGVSRYRFEVLIVPVSGVPFPIVFELETEGLLSS